MLNVIVFHWLVWFLYNFFTQLALKTYSIPIVIKSWKKVINIGAWRLVVLFNIILKCLFQTSVKDYLMLCSPPSPTHPLESAPRINSRNPWILTPDDNVLEFCPLFCPLLCYYCLFVSSFVLFFSLPIHLHSHDHCSASQDGNTLSQILVVWVSLVKCTVGCPLSVRFFLVAVVNSFISEMCVFVGAVRNKK